jgi:serine/threonine-protein kinase PknK
MVYRWPGNVRQLENVLTKAYYWSTRVVIELRDVELPSRLATPRRALDRAQFERDEARRIVDALHQARWNMSAVARELGIPRNTLYRKLGKYQIARPADGT